MKKQVFYALIFGVASLGITACTQENEDSITSGKTRLMVDLSTDVSFKAPSARSINESFYTDIRNYSVKLEKTAGNELIHSDLYSNWELAYEVESGVEYRLSASYGEATPASYDKLLVSGSETFTVQAGSTKTVSFQCKPQAAKVSVIYSEDFTNFFSDCIVSIKTKHMNEAWNMSIADVGKELYLQSDAQESIELAFDIKDKDGESISPEGFTGTKTVTVSPQTWLKLTIKPDVTEIEGGKFGINVSVNTDVIDEDVNIVIPSDIFNQ